VLCLYRNIHAYARVTLDRIQALSEVKGGLEPFKNVSFLRPLAHDDRAYESKKTRV